MDLKKSPQGLTKQGQRNLSEFAASELIYAFVQKTLDVETARALQQNIQESKDLQKQYSQIQNAVGYLVKLGRTQVSQELTEKLNEPTGAMVWILERIRFHDWPQELRWGVESFLIGATIALTLLLVPWEQLKGIHFTRKAEIILAEADRHKESRAEFPDSTNSKEGEPSFSDEGLALNSINTKNQTWENITWPPWREFTVAPSLLLPRVVEAPSAESAVVVSSVDVKTKTEKMNSIVNASSVDSAEVAESSKTEVKENAVVAPMGTGFLWRGSVSVANAEAVVPKLVEKIAELGGRKAGSVALGWKKDPGVFYFHLTIPENKFEDFRKYISGYGVFQLKKEKHERVMPDGIIRVIFQAEEKNLTTTHTISSPPNGTSGEGTSGKASP